jgi:VanZ family protein
VNRLASWLPPLAWMAVIAWFSTGTWSAEHTGGLLLTIARTLAPWLTPRDLVALNHLVRKLAHITVYGILAALWWRALVREAWAPSRAGWTALAVSLAWATLDEAHQALEPSRTGSAADVAIDGAGAAAALVFLRLGIRDAMAATTTFALWAAAVGGVVLLVIDGLAGLSSGLLWLTTLIAALALLLDRWRRRNYAG